MRGSTTTIHSSRLPKFLSFIEYSGVLSRECLLRDGPLYCTFSMIHFSMDSLQCCVGLASLFGMQWLCPYRNELSNTCDSPQLQIQTEIENIYYWQYSVNTGCTGHIAQIAQVHLTHVCRIDMSMTMMISQMLIHVLLPLQAYIFWGKFKVKVTSGDTKHHRRSRKGVF